MCIYSNIKAFAVSLISIGLVISTANADNKPQSQPQQNSMEIILTINNEQTVSAVLEDNQTAKDFIRLLPLTLALKDYNNTEKVSDALPKALGKSDDSFVPRSGDLTYYAPWGNLAIFYRDFKQSRNLFKIGTLQQGGDIFDIDGDIIVTFELKEGSQH